MKYGLFLYLLFFMTIPAFCQSPVDTAQQIVKGEKNSPEQQKKPYVILISADGFRYDYAQKYNAEHLKALAASGVQAKYMLPSYPTVTFPNHYAMITGLVPSHSGLVSNNFFDRKRNEAYMNTNRKLSADGTWYGGTPLWVLAQKQGLLSASFYWIASDADVQKTFPAYYYRYNEKIPIDQRISTVVSWLKLPAGERPHFITFYFPEVDHEGHHHTPDSPEAAAAVKFVDSAVYALTQAVKTTGLDVNFIFVSDHGMIAADNKDPIELSSVVDTAKYMAYGDTPMAMLYPKPGKEVNIVEDYNIIKKKADGFKVYLKNNMPERLQFDAANDRYNRIGDIILVANSGKVFQFGKYNINPGQHGYDVNKVPEMRASFYAWGPAFKHGATIKPFKNVSIYNLVSNILGLTITEPVDGDNKLAEKVLLKK
jgi:predicted AlkP superfamily pyrophosphatase or phosphodiesterase